MSDDAFYRMLANLLRIPNCNLVGLLHVVEFGNQKRAIEVWRLPDGSVFYRGTAE